MSSKFSSIVCVSDERVELFDFSIDNLSHVYLHQHLREIGIVRIVDEYLKPTDETIIVRIKSRKNKHVCKRIADNYHSGSWFR
jgi:hypothetical protein